MDQNDTSVPAFSQAAGSEVLSAVPKEPSATVDVLSNKMTIQVISDPYAYEIKAALLIKVGSYHDPVGKEGLAHFLEHVLLPRSLNEEYENNNCGKIRLSTGGLYTSCEVNGVDTHTSGQFLLNTLKELMTADIDPKLVSDEKETIHVEIGIEDDDPRKRLYREASNALYSARNLAFGNLGDHNTLDNITLADLQEFKSRHYNASNIVLTFVAKPDIAEFLRQEASSVFQSLRPGDRSPSPSINPISSQMKTAASLNLLYFSIGLPYTVSRQFSEIDQLYREYLQAQFERHIVGKKTYYLDLDNATPRTSTETGHLLISSAIDPRKADRLMPVIADIIGRTAHSIDVDLFNKLRDRAARLDGKKFLRGCREYAMALAFGGEPDRKDSIAEFTAADMMRYAHERVLCHKPSLCTYGDSSKLHSLAEFEVMLHEAAKPPKAAPAPTNMPS